jgi:glycosyltransferase involved in cell wall biosynthesis
MKFDLVHTQAPFTMGRVGMRLARRYSIPLVTTNHTVYTEYTHYLPLLPSGLARRGIMWLMESYCNHCDYVVTPSESVRHLLESIGVSTPIRAVPTGPDEERRVERDSGFLRKEFNISPSAPLLLYAGRVAKEKNMEMLVDAFHLIHQEVPDAKLMIVGSGPHEEMTRHHVSSLNLTDHVIFTGFLSREQVSKCYADATAFLFASITDAQGLVVAEAMMQGLPAVATAAYGPAEWIDDGETGFLCQNDPNSMARYALRLIQNPELRQQMGHAAYEHASARSAPRCAEVMLDVYREAAARNAERLITIV